jgi:uncharacterized protein
MSTLPEELPQEDLPRENQAPGNRPEARREREADLEHPQLEPWPLPPLPSEAQPLEVQTLEAQPLEAEPPNPSAETTALDPDGFSAYPPSEPAAQPLYDSYTPPEIIRPPRIPHLGHLVILALLLALGLAGDFVAVPLALHFHLFGVSTATEAMTEIHYTLGSEAVLYVMTLAGCMLVFPLIWHKDFFAGISWRGATARRLSPMLIGAAFVCFLLALVNGWLMPGPPDAPIDKMFRMPGAAWLLFVFGVTFAPFFEELVFRGFLLPALCTACDWTAEKVSGHPARPLAADGLPQWSVPAMIVASILTSLPFAGMHAAQTGYSLGPFVLLICVSLVLCAARLVTRSLAASVVVHASYNFMLFSLMLFGTGGFRHLENM